MDSSLTNLNALILFFYILIFELEEFVLKKEDIKIKHVILHIIIQCMGILLLEFYDTDLMTLSTHICTIICYQILLSQCIIDFKKMELSDINNVALFILSIIHAYLNGFQNYHISFLIIGIGSLILYFLPISNMGFGDVKLLMATALFVRTSLLPSYIFYMLLIALFIGFFYKLLKKSDIFPMGPAIATMC
ncbi:MAG: A24 family peptidase, partial [Anaeroplasmataceae bacterium]|nr:A24 family peptidase [Anaeroplasmataceae bacterium]